MLYIDKPIRKYFLEAVRSDTKKEANEKDFLSSALDTAKKEISDEIKQSFTDRSSWFVRKIVLTPETVEGLNNVCKGYNFSLDNDTLVLKKDNNEIRSASKAFITVTIACISLSKKFDKISREDKLLDQYALDLKEVVNDIIDSERFPIDKDVIDTNCESSNEIGKIITNITQYLLLSDKFDIFKMMLLLIISRILRTDSISTAIKYLITVIYKLSSQIDNIDSEKVIIDLKDNYANK